MVGGVPTGFDGRLDDVIGSRKIGLARAETDDRLARRLEGLGLRVHREGGRLGDGRDASGDSVVLGHRAMVARDGPPHRTE